MSQFRKYNRPTVLDFVWSFFLKLNYWYFGHDLFFEFGSQIYRFRKNVNLGKNVYLKKNATVGCANPIARIVVGNNTTIGFNSIIIASKSISIGCDCMIAPNVLIVDSNHGMDTSKPFNLQNNISKEVDIGNNVWIGAGVVILPGVKIVDNSIIGAGSLVAKSIEEPGVYIGNPARKK
jgi:acetyltransferase-like isoleucine patch superfamily enzyme